MMRKIILFSLFLLFLLLPSLARAQDEYHAYSEESLEGTVTEVVSEDSYEVQGIKQYFQKLRIFITKGSVQGKTIEVDSGVLASANSRKYKEGDKLLIAYAKDLAGSDTFFITDYVRRDALLVLFIIFAVLAILIGRFHGVASLIGMAVTFVVIFKYVLPRILAGDNPVLVAILGSVFIVPFTFGLTHGFELRTYIAIAGTLLTLVIVGLTSVFFINYAKLTGFSAEEASFLQFDVGSSLSMVGILLAGIIIASLGILDDITVSQVSVVHELKEANKSYGFKKLFAKGMNVGRDHIASLVNTLVLVYTGASLPLLLLFITNPRPFSEIVNYEMVAEEIVRTLVGSIGLILAVPITTFIAAYYFQRKATDRK